MRVLVTGGLGFVGQATIKQAKAEHQTPVFDVMNGDDIRSKHLFAKTVQSLRPDRILHLAAIARFSEADEDPVRAFETNVLGTKNVAEVASEQQIPLVYASTGSVYMPVKRKPPITEDFQGCGNSVYGCTKYAGELYVRRSNAPWIILRYAHLYGAEKRYHGLIGGFLTRIQRGLAPTLYGGKQSNDFTYIGDVAAANWAALEAPWDSWNQVYNVGTGEELSAEDAGAAVCKAFGYVGKIDRVEQRTVDPDRFVFDCSKAERMLGFKAKYDFRSGLEAMKNEIRQQNEDLAPREVRTA